MKVQVSKDCTPGNKVLGQSYFGIPMNYASRFLFAKVPIDPVAFRHNRQCHHGVHASSDRPFRISLPFAVRGVKILRVGRRGGFKTSALENPSAVLCFPLHLRNPCNMSWCENTHALRGSTFVEYVS